MSTPMPVLSKTQTETNTKRGKALCVPHFEKIVKNCSELSKGMSLLMADLVSERIGTTVANSVCNSAGKMLKAVEMQQRYGKTTVNSVDKELHLIG